MKKILITSFIIMSSTTAVHANDWGGNAELGLIQTSGNTDTSSFNIKGKGTNTFGGWRATVEAEALKSDSSGVTTSERYGVSGQADWKLNDASYIYVRASYDEDKYAGFNSRTVESVGYGHSLTPSNNTNLVLEAGVGARQSENILGATTNDEIVRLSALFDWRISDKALFSQELKTEGGVNGYITSSLTSVTTQVSGALSSKISYNLRNNSDAPIGVDSNDATLSASLVFSY